MPACSPLVVALVITRMTGNKRSDGCYLLIARGIIKLASLLSARAGVLVAQFCPTNGPRPRADPDPDEAGGGAAGPASVAVRSAAKGCVTLSARETDPGTRGLSRDARENIVC